MRKLLLIAVLACTSAHAEFRDGNKLLAEMNGTFGDKMLAMGYIAGTVDSLNNITICAPYNLTLGQATDMVRQYLENNPGVRHFSADAIVNRVMSSAWPCAKKGSGV